MLDYIAKSRCVTLADLLDSYHSLVRFQKRLLMLSRKHEQAGSYLTKPGKARRLLVRLLWARMLVVDEVLDWSYRLSRNSEGS
jgi:hypothetical protein